MATKSQLISFIMEMFEEADGNEISKSKLDSYKKSELEELIKARGLEAELEAWLNK